ncbi:hypothetical protein HYZ76_01000, partial [Candidatus Falkowbacteria bacterium]|nr:hypothetical protein [Candidatus Falkowbacteria bacterium]
MKLTTFGAVIGLTSLLGGCDNNKEIELAACDVGGLQARAIYHQQFVGVDYTTLDLYKDGKIVGSLSPRMDNGTYDWVQCDDG